MICSGKGSDLVFDTLKAALLKLSIPQDERLVFETNRIYRNGFLLFMLGYLLYSWRGFMISQVSYVNNLTETWESHTDPFLSAWFLLTMLVIGVQLFRKGVFVPDKPAAYDLFPVGRSLALSLSIAGSMFVFATLMRAFVEFELLGPGGVNWLHDVVIAAVFAFEVFVIFMIGHAVVYFAARRRVARFDD